MNSAEKLAAAIAFLGEHYVLHPARRIPKGDYEPIVQRVNVADTIKRVKARTVSDAPRVVTL